MGASCNTADRREPPPCVSWPACAGCVVRLEDLQRLLGTRQGGRADACGRLAAPGLSVELEPVQLLCCLKFVQRKALMALQLKLYSYSCLQHNSGGAKWTKAPTASEECVGTEYCMSKVQLPSKASLFMDEMARTP